MKKILLLSIGIALSVACQQENTPGSLEQKTGTDYLASLECFDGPTKTSMTEDNGIVWTKGDQIAIFQGATVADTYQVKDQCDGTASGIFTLVSDNSEVNGEFSSGMEIPANIAVYPYSEGLGCSSATVTDGGITATSYTISGFDFPSVQQYQANSFAQESFAMVAVTSSMSDHNLRFRNVNGALKLQLRGKCVVKSIKLEGNDNEKLAGASSITAYPGTTVPSIKMSSEATGAITLDCGEGAQLDPSVPTIFIISVPPTVFSKGFTVTVVDTEGTEMLVKASVSNEIKRSSILKMPVVTVPVDAGLYGLEVTDCGWMELPATVKDGREFFHLDMTVNGVKTRNFSYDWDFDNLVSHWVAYPLNKSLSGSGKYDYLWGLDPNLPLAYQSNISRKGYGDSRQYARGHQCPRADRQLTQETVAQTCYGTNMTPQLHDFNGGIWLNLENMVRNWGNALSSNDTLYVVTGCKLADNPMGAGRGAVGGYTLDNDGKNVAIPVGYYKAVLRYQKNSTYGYQGYTACAFYLTHEANGGAVTKSMAVSIDELERITGIDFFVNLPKAIGESDAEKVESQNPQNVGIWW